MKRFLLITTFLLILPLCSIGKSGYIPSVAFAGHTLAGGWCECGAPGCICDPGEVGGSARPAPGEKRRGDTATGRHGENADLASLGLLGLTVLIVMLRRFGA